MFHRSDEKSSMSTSLRVLLGTLAAVLIFAFGYTIGGSTSVQGSAWTGGGLLGSLTEEPQVDMSTFWQVWELAKKNYVDQPVDEQELLNGAMEGVVWALGDPYSTYFTPELATEFSNDLEGTFSGIGAEISERDAGITVVAPLPETPAERAGVRSGDIIAAIDGESTAGKSVDEAVRQIRGEAGTSVTLTLARVNVELFNVTIQREEIHTKSVTWEVQSDGIAVVTISVFNEDTTELFAEAVDELLAADAKGLVVDLRNDPGGLLVAAIDVAAFWTGNLPVVIEQFRDKQESYRGNSTALLAEMPTVVLVNGGSASGSEILAGALQDHGLAVIMGETTFGKGSVQEYYDLPGGAAAKITVARWLTPLGRTIHEVGITPDIEVTESIEQIHAGETPQMDAAIRHLTQN